MKNIFCASLCLASLSMAARPGDQQPIGAINPAYTRENIRPAAVNFPIGAMDFLSSGDLVVVSWKDPYEVFILHNATGPKAGITVTKFATGLLETLGMKVVNDSIYVLQKDELTLLLDHDKNGVADEYRTIAYDWTKSVMEKEYAFGLVYDGTYFYASYGDPTVNGGTAVNPAPAGRLNGILRLGRDGTVTPFCGGLRVPGGMEYAFGDLWVTDNQGGYRPSGYLINARQARWYGRPLNPPSVFQPIPYQQYPDNGAQKPLHSPLTINLPFQEVGGRSPGQPVIVRNGVFKGQFFVPDADAGGDCMGGTCGGMSRVFVEKVNGEFQGAVFHFSQGFEGTAVYRAAWGKDGALYSGSNGATNAGWGRMTRVGMDRLMPTAATAFEMLAVRTLGATSFEIEFTKPLAASLGADVAARLAVQKWWNRPQETYGAGYKQGLVTLTVTSAVVSTDRMKVTVVMPNITVGYDYYFHWTGDVLATTAGEKLWGTEAWYTLANFGPAQPLPPIDPTPIAVEGSRAPAVHPFSVSRASGHVLVQLKFAEGAPFTVEVADLQGKVWASRSGRGADQIVFSPGDLPGGIYVLKAVCAGKTYSQLGFR